MPNNSTNPPARKQKRNVALFGTMATRWRELLTPSIRRCGYDVIDNMDVRWLSATTAEEILPLLEQDLSLMRTADVILWHHDGDSHGHTARIELGILSRLGIPILVHVDPGVSSREYMRALTIVFRERMHWMETVDDIVVTLRDLTTRS